MDLQKASEAFAKAPYIRVIVRPPGKRDDLAGLKFSAPKLRVALRDYIEKHVSGIWFPSLEYLHPNCMPIWLRRVEGRETGHVYAFEFEVKYYLFYSVWGRTTTRPQHIGLDARGNRSVPKTVAQLIRNVMDTHSHEQRRLRFLGVVARTSQSTERDSYRQPIFWNERYDVYELPYTQSAVERFLNKHRPEEASEVAS